MSGEQRFRAVLRWINHFLVFFLLAAIVITCCITLFLSQLAQHAGLEFTRENISDAARLTFANVLFLSLVFTVIDIARRRYYVHRPVRAIVNALQKLMQGDFSVRIGPVPDPMGENHFGELVACCNTLAAELSGTETLRTDFIANVSHELKTPLAVMRNYAAMLQQPGLTEQERMEYAAVIADTCRRLADLITNILRLNKLENQQIFPAAVRFDLGEQLRLCLIQFESQWEQKNIDIETDMEEDVFIRSDEELLSLVWNNLISNAMKFTPEGGTVKLGLHTDEKYVYVSVSDTGCGMSAEVGQHIFEKFYQGDTSHASRGNGLGLALVKRVMDILSGEIRVESALGKGTTFTVRVNK